MSHIVKYNCQALKCSVECVMVNGEPWFKGKSVADCLGYDRPSNAIRDHVPEKYKKRIKT